MLNKSKKTFYEHLQIQIHHFAGEEFSFLILRNRDIEGISFAFKIRISTAYKQPFTNKILL